MYAVQVRDHIMVAHSLKGEVFGPAQGMHGATYVVDATFYRSTLGEERIVVDIGRATDALKAALGQLNYGNLDELFPGELTTTEWLAKWVFDELAGAAGRGEFGPGGDQVERIRVTLNESHTALAWYEADL
ncbi:MAG: 6-pyruvoyl trahydropterin synthase family protein [Pikeienuella sp.]